jgi:hypothetical protein
LVPQPQLQQQQQMVPGADTPLSEMAAWVQQNNPPGGETLSDESSTCRMALAHPVRSEKLHMPLGFDLR